MQERLLTPDEVAVHIGCETKTLATWRSKGRHGLPYVKVGARVRYRQCDVEAWLAQRSMTQTT